MLRAALRLTTGLFAIFVHPAGTALIQVANLAGKVLLVDAEDVFDLVWLKLTEGHGQLERVNQPGLRIESQCPRTFPGAGVEVDGLRQEAELGSDPQGGVVEVQLSDSGAGAQRGLKQLVELREAGSRSHFVELLEQHVPRIGKGCRCEPVLVAVASSLRCLGKGGASDGGRQGRLSPKRIQLGSCVGAVVGEVVPDDRREVHVHPTRPYNTHGSGRRAVYARPMDQLGLASLLTALWTKHARETRVAVSQEISKLRVRFAAGNVDVNSGSPLAVQLGVEWTQLEALVRMTVKELESRLEPGPQVARFLKQDALSVLAKLAAEEVRQLPPVGPVAHDAAKGVEEHRQRLTLHLESIASVELSVLATTAAFKESLPSAAHQVPDRLDPAREEVLRTCASKVGRSPPENWATWEAGGDHEAHALLDLAAHDLEGRGLIEARFLPGKAGFAAWITARGLEHLRTIPQLPPPGTYVFVDTNLILRGQPLKDIDWATLLRADKVELVVCRAVLDELHSKTYDRDQWMRERARKGNAQLQEIAAREGEIRDRVRLVTAKGELDRDQLRPHGLVYDSGDDRIIGTALMFRRGDPTGITLASFDNNLLSRAPSYGLGAFKVPDKLRVPIPADPRDVELRKLQATIEQLRSTQPTLDLVFASGDREHTIEFCGLGRKDAIALEYVREWTSALEQVPSDVLDPGPSANDAAAYWAFANAQAETEEKLARCQPVGFAVRNLGHHPASGVRVTIEAQALVEELNPLVEFPYDPVLQIPVRSPRWTSMLMLMPRFVGRPVRMVGADPTATPGVSAAHRVEGRPHAFRYAIQGDVRDRESARLPEVHLLLRDDGVSSRVLLRYEIQVTGVPDNTFVGELAILLKR